MLAVVLGFGLFEGYELGIWVGVVFVSVLLHELGHALTAQAFGRQPTVTLHAFGGLTSWPAHPELPPAKRVLVTIAGPFAGFALAGVAWLAFNFGGLDEASRAVRLTLGITIWVNLLWGVFNMIPIRGLDGGQTVAGLLALWWPKRAAIASEVVFVVAGVAAAAFGLLRGYLLLALFAILFTFGPMFGRRSPQPPAGAGLTPQPTGAELPPPPPPPPDREPPLLGI